MRNVGLQTGALLSSIIVASLLFDPAAVAANNEAGIAARLAKLERTLDNRGLVDLLQTVDQLQQEVQRMLGLIEEQSYVIEQLRKTQRETYVDIDQRLQEIQKRSDGTAGESGRVTMVPPLTTLTPSAPDSVAGTPAPQSSLQMEMQTGEQNAVATAAEQIVSERTRIKQPFSEPNSLPSAIVVPPPSIAPLAPTIDNRESETAYKDAFSLLKAGQYDESIAAFNDFLQLHPNSQYADNAQYWLGETFYVRREFEPAVAEYQLLIKNYPASKKRSHAMLKIGYSYHELGQLDKARAVLEDLRRRYSGSTAARLAEDRIQRMLAEASAE